MKSSKIMYYIKTDDELFRLDVETLVQKGLDTDENIYQAYIKNLIIYPY